MIDEKKAGHKVGQWGKGHGSGKSCVKGLNLIKAQFLKFSKN